MKYVVTVVLLLLVIAAPGPCAARAGDDAQVERILLEQRADAQELMMRRLFELIEEYGEALEASRVRGGVGGQILRLRIEQLEASLEEERKRTGLDKEALMIQLAREQHQHTADVMLLQSELTAANVISERNRIEATMALQNGAMAGEENIRLRSVLVRGIAIVGKSGDTSEEAARWLAEIAASGDAVLKKAVSRASAPPDDR